MTAIGADTDNSITSQGSEASSNGVGRVLPAITLDPTRLQTQQEENQDITKMKAKLSENVFQVPPPGKSVDFSKHKKLPKFDSGEFIELQEKLQKLTNASRTSHETFASAEDVKPADQFHSRSVQTSLTDLSFLSKVPVVHDASTQDDLPRFYPPMTSTTSSSSQTESHLFLKPSHHVIDANVIKIRVPSGGGDDSSSIPSSYEGSRPSEPPAVVLPTPLDPRYVICSTTPPPHLLFMTIVVVSDH